MILLIVAAVAGGEYWWYAQPISVDIAQPHRGPAVLGVYATGTVEPSVMVPIAARTGGHLITLNADEGDTAAPDQVLARVESTDLEASVAELKSREDYARRELARMTILLRSKVVSKEEHDRAQTDLEAAVAARDAAQAQLSYTQLRAPAQGLIIRRDGEIGEFIEPGQTVFWMSCCAPLRITAEVDEEDIPLVRVGQNVLIRADAFPGQVFKGKVQSITPKGDPVARSYRMRVSFDEPDVPLMIGMTAETNVILRKTENALLVPSSAVVTNEEGKSFLWGVAQGMLHRMPVTVGAKGAQETEITTGLSDQDVFVQVPENEFEDGQTVRVQRAHQN